MLVQVNNRKEIDYLKPDMVQKILDETTI